MPGYFEKIRAFSNAVMKRGADIPAPALGIGEAEIKAPIGITYNVGYSMPESVTVEPNTIDSIQYNANNSGLYLGGY